MAQLLHHLNGTSNICNIEHAVFFHSLSSKQAREYQWWKTVQMEWHLSCYILNINPCSFLSPSWLIQNATEKFMTLIMSWHLAYINSKADTFNPFCTHMRARTHTHTHGGINQAHSESLDSLPIATSLHRFFPLSITAFWLECIKPLSAVIGFCAATGG